MIDFEALGKSDMRLGPLQIWVHGREREDSQDFWDANWLRVTAYCSTGFARVMASGSILHLSELSSWRDQLAALHEAMSGTAHLETMEEHLAASIELKDGKGSLRVAMTGDHHTEHHEFIVEIDQSYFPAMLSDLDRLLSAYPVRGCP